MTGWTSIARTAAVAALLSACATTPPENVACENSAAFRLPVSTTPATEMLLGDETVEIERGSAEAAILRAMTKDDETGPYRPRTIAVLSGGGEFGAYGAGFFESYLKGAGEGVVFDVVTGVSTGALQTTGVFLGGEDDLADLVEGFAIARETDLATERRSLGRLPLTASIYSLEPARARFGDFLTDERIARVADAARRGRKLLVGVVEVQDGRFYAFDLTAIAASGRPAEDVRRCYVEAVFASAAVPVVFPPVLLDDRQYFDGGVRASVFLDSTVQALGAMPEAYAKDAKVYVMFNGFLDTPHEDDLVIDIADTLARTREITFDQIDRTSLQRITDLAERFDVSWARVTPGLCLEERKKAPDEMVFNAPFMACLIREGRKEGATPAPFTRIE